MCACVHACARGALYKVRACMVRYARCVRACVRGACEVCGACVPACVLLGVGCLRACVRECVGGGARCVVRACCEVCGACVVLGVWCLRACMHACVRAYMMRDVCMLTCVRRGRGRCKVCGSCMVPGAWGEVRGVWWESGARCVHGTRCVMCACVRGGDARCVVGASVRALCDVCGACVVRVVRYGVLGVSFRVLGVVFLSYPL